MAQAAIGVYARIRPDTQSALSSSEIRVVEAPEPRAILARNLEFSLDGVFDRDASQESVYALVAQPRVARVSEGVNACVIAYGQTGSGKTHTMFGPDEVMSDWKSAAAEKQHGAESARDTRARKEAADFLRALGVYEPRNGGEAGQAAAAATAVVEPAQASGTTVSRATAGPRKKARSSSSPGSEAANEPKPGPSATS